MSFWASCVAIHVHLHQKNNTISSETQKEKNESLSDFSITSKKEENESGNKLKNYKNTSSQKPNNQKLCSFCKENHYDFMCNQCFI